MPTHVDGNALAGPLSEIFRIDMTTATCCCDGCGDVASLASEMVYRGLGTVVRCRQCDDVLMVFVETPNQTVMSVRGLRSLSVPAPPPQH
jgi:Family of unknown function (DUF6510)